MQTPNCQYTFTLDARKVFDGTDIIDTQGPLPIEVGFNADSATFALSKCHTYGDLSSSDPDCTSGQSPYVIQHKIALIVRLDDPVGTWDAKTFNVRIEGCSLDSLFLNGGVSVYDYTIYGQAQSWAMPVDIDQTYDLCQVECAITVLYPPIYPSFLDFNYVASPTDNPAFIDKTAIVSLETNEPTLDGNYIDVRFACTSIFAAPERIEGGIAMKTQDLRINLYDVCRFASIQGATSEDVVMPLFQTSFSDLI